MTWQQAVKGAGQKNWSDFQSQQSKYGQGNWDEDLQTIRARYANDPQQQAQQMMTQYLGNMNADLYLSPQMRKWMVQRAPLAYMQSTMDTLTGKDNLTANQLQGGLDWNQLTNWLNSTSGGSSGINGYNSATANQKWGIFNQRLADASNPNSTMDAGTRGIWNNMNESDFLDYQRMLMQSTLAPSLYDAADSYLTNAWQYNQNQAKPAKYGSWLPSVTGNPMFNSRW